MENINWEEIKETLQNAVELEKTEDLMIKLIIKEPNIEENLMVGNMLKNENEMKQFLSAFISEGRPIDCDVEVNQDERHIILKFKDKELWEKIYEFFNDLFFGDYLKKMVEAMMGAFGGMYGNGE